MIMKIITFVQICFTIIISIYSIYSFFELYKNRKRKRIDRFIKDYKNFLVNKRVFKNQKAVEFFFTNGGCYLFAQILQDKFSNTKLMINKDKNHCKVLYEDYLFDIYGGILKTLDNETYEEVTIKDILYIKECFGFNNYPYNMTRIEFDTSFKKETLFSFKNNCSCYWKNIIID